MGSATRRGLGRTHCIQKMQSARWLLIDEIENVSVELLVAIEAQIAALRCEAEAESAEVAFSLARETLYQRTAQQSTGVMAHLRGADMTGSDRKNGKR